MTTLNYVLDEIEKRLQTFCVVLRASFNPATVSPRHGLLHIKHAHQVYKYVLLLLC